MSNYTRGIRSALEHTALVKYAGKGDLIERVLTRTPGLDYLAAYGPGIAATSGAGAGIGALTAPEGERGRGALRGALIGGGLAGGGLAASRLAQHLAKKPRQEHMKELLKAIREKSDLPQESRKLRALDTIGDYAQYPAIAPTAHAVFGGPASWLPLTAGIPLGVGAVGGAAGGLSTKKKPWHERLRERLGG